MRPQPEQTNLRHSAIFAILRDFLSILSKNQPACMQLHGVVFYSFDFYLSGSLLVESMITFGSVGIWVSTDSLMVTVSEITLTDEQSNASKLRSIVLLISWTLSRNWMIGDVPPIMKHHNWHYDESTFNARR